MRARIRTTQMALAALTLVATALAVAPATHAQAPAGPRFGENYRLSASDTPARSRDVPGLAVNPANPDHIVEADANPVNLQCDYHVSFDGGRTWTGGHLTIANGGEIPPFPTPACSQSFDSGGYAHFNTGIVFGSGQNVYITFSAHRGPFNRPEGGNDGGDGDDTVVARSTDGGRTFAPAVRAVHGGGPVAASPLLAGRALRPQLAVQRGAGTGGQDRLYVAVWDCLIRIRASQTGRGGCSGGGGDRRIWVARSDDAGATWANPVLASAANVRTGGAIAEAGSPDEQAREPSQPVVGPDGAVYVAYRNRDITDGTTCPANPQITTLAPGGFSADNAHCIVVARSTNQGATWTQFSTGQPVSPATLSNPRLAIDPAAPAGAGTLHVVYQRPVSPDPSDISLQSSTDRGQTWSSAVRVNDDPAGFIQTNPNVFVSEAPAASHPVHVIWGDRRHTYPGGAVGDTYYARLTAAGSPIIPNRRITDRTFNIDVGSAHELGSELTPGFSWYGPVAVPLPGDGLLAAWTDSREGNVDDAFQDIYLSRLNNTGSIARRSIATATPAGLSVMLSRLAYPGGTEALGDRGGEPASRLVVVNEGDQAAALAGAVLARAKWGPLLLSPAAALPAHVRAEAARMEPQGAYLIGDTTALSPAVSEGIRATTRDGDGVVRVSAPLNIQAVNRPAELARRVAELMAPLPGTAPEAVIANPGRPEAAAAAGLAAALRLPILFVDSRPTMPPPTSAAITALGIKKVLIAGGTQAVPAGVEAQLTALLDGPNVVRLNGADEYATSALAFAEGRTASAARGLPANVVYVAEGSRPVEGAVLAAAVGRLNGLMLLESGASAATAEAHLVALGQAAAVDRIVGAIGTGGTDPAVPAPPPAPPPPVAPPPPPVAAAPALAGCPSAADRTTIQLSNGNDTRNGTPLADLIVAGAGNDVVDGLAGSDCIDLGPGTDRGQGGAGDDFVQGGLGNDRLRGGSGRDSLRGFSGNDRLEGDAGNDTSLGGSGSDVLLGGLGDDRLGGDAGADDISGGAGADRIAGDDGNDRIAGNSGADRIFGYAGNDRITGGTGDDRLSGGTGADTISGGTGADAISARDDRRDRITCGAGRDTVTADFGDVVARDCERVRRR